MKKRQKQQQQVAPQEDAQPQTEFWSLFFRCQRNPILRSQLVAALLVGTPLEVDRLPSAALLDAVLLATASRAYCESEIVDDYTALLRRTDEEWRRPDWTSKVFDSIHTGTANFILHGSTEFVCVEEQYIPTMVQDYLQGAMPNCFVKELPK